MKTKYMISKVLKVFALVTMALTLANCSKDSGGGGGTTTNTGYQYINNQCIQTSTNTVVAQSFCVGNNGYSYNGYNQCIQTSTGQIVANTFCANTTNNGYSYNTMGQCIQTSTGQIVANNLCTNNGSVGGYRNCNGQAFMHSQYGYVVCGQNINCTGMQVNDPSGTYTCQ